MSCTIRVQMQKILREGTLHFEPHWGVYKDIRRGHIVRPLNVARGRIQEKDIYSVRESTYPAKLRAKRFYIKDSGSWKLQKD